MKERDLRTADDTSMGQTDLSECIANFERKNGPRVNGSRRNYERSKQGR